MTGLCGHIVLLLVVTFRRILSHLWRVIGMATVRVLQEWLVGQMEAQCLVGAINRILKMP